MYINGKNIEIGSKTAVATGKAKKIEAAAMSVEPLVTTAQLGCNDAHINAQSQRVFDTWHNQIASIGRNNSLQQFTDYTLQRLPYQMCASLATDAIIHKAIEVISEETFGKGGSFVQWASDDTEGLEDGGVDITEFNAYFTRQDYLKIAREAFQKALIFGGSFIYIQTSDSDTSKQLYFDNAGNTRFSKFVVLEPWQLAPAQVNTSNPIGDDYMEPSLWYVQGAGVVHRSRLIKVIPFPVTSLYKPMFNYLGLSLIYFMKDYVAVADTVRQSLGDLFLRFATVVIKAPNHKISNQQGYDRIKHILETRNNLGAVVLSGDEEYVVDNMSLSGLSDIVQHAYELVTASSYVPTVKLLGIEPSGFASTGEYSLNNFYDTIMAFQRNIILPYLIRMGEVVNALHFGNNVSFNFVWKKLGQISERDSVDILTAKLDYLLRLKEADILSAEDVVRAIQADDMTLAAVDADNLPDEDSDDDMEGFDGPGEVTAPTESDDDKGETV